MTMAKGDIHTVPHDDGWANLREGNQRVTRTYDTQAAANQVGKADAIRNGVEHLIHGQDGQIRKRNTYPRSRDPKNTKG